MKRPDHEEHHAAIRKHPDFQSFYRALLHSPNDHTLWGSLADWLEERDAFPNTVRRIRYQMQYGGDAFVDPRPASLDLSPTQDRATFEGPSGSIHFGDKGKYRHDHIGRWLYNNPEHPERAKWHQEYHKYEPVDGLPGLLHKYRINPTPALQRQIAQRAVLEHGSDEQTDSFLRIAQHPDARLKVEFASDGNRHLPTGIHTNLSPGRATVKTGDMLAHFDRPTRLSRLTVYKNGQHLGHIDTENRSASSESVRSILPKLDTRLHPSEPGWAESLTGWKSIGDDTYYIGASHD